MKILGTNGDPEKVVGWLKAQITDSDLGPGGRVVIHQHVPQKFAMWIKRDAKKRGYSVSFFGSLPTISILTKEMLDRGEKQRRDKMKADQDRYDYPG